MGRLINQAEVEQIAEKTQVLLTAYRVDDPQLSPELRAAHAHLPTETSLYIHPLNSQSIAGYGLVPDIMGQPALILRVEMAREIHERGLGSLWYFMIALVSTGIVFGIMILLMLEYTVLSPLAQLNTNVSQIALGGDPARRVASGGKDELGQLARGVNEMLDALERSQRNIRDSEQRLRTVISSAPIILFALDAHGQIMFLEGLGLGEIDPHPFIGQPLSALFGTSDDLQEGIKRALSGDVGTNLVEHNGTVFETRQRPLKDPQGEIVGVIGVATDITERGRAEAAEYERRVMAEALRDTAEALTGTLNLGEVFERILTNVGSVVQHDATNIMLVEGEWVRVVGAQGYAERDLDDWIRTLRVPLRDMSHVQTVVETGQSLICPDVNADGQVSAWPEMAWIQARATAPICLERHVIGVLNLESATPGFFTPDHAEWLQTFADQAALAIRNAQLFEDERHERLLAQTLRKTAEALAASMNLEDTLSLILDQLGQVSQADRVMIMLLDGDDLKVVGQRGFAQTADITRLTYRYADFPLLGAVVQTREPLVLADVQHDDRWLHMAGLNTSTRSWIGMPLIARDIIIGLFSVASDRPDAYHQPEVDAVAAFAQQAALAVENSHILTELENSLQELRQAQSQLVRTARLSAAGEIAAGVAHQINNPLTTIMAEDYLLLQSLDPHDTNYELAEAIREAAERAGAVVQRLLDLTRVNPYKKELVDLNFSLQNSIALICAQIVPQIARLDVDLTPDLPGVLASPQHLEDVWINLLLNARDAVTAQEYGVIRISSGLDNLGNKLCVTVQDNGGGIDLENLQRIFEPFFTTKDYGTGLGLSICHEVIVRHGGTILVDSVKGQGTTFTVMLPADMPA